MQEEENSLGQQGHDQPSELNTTQNERPSDQQIEEKKEQGDASDEPIQQGNATEEPI